MAILALEDPRWGSLKHAYGLAADIPKLLRAAAQCPPDNETDGPYHDLWSSLCHQGDVYPSSYAAVPHLVQIVAENPTRAPWTILALVTLIEAGRHGANAPPIPDFLYEAYDGALARIPAIIPAIAQVVDDETYVRVLSAALAASLGEPALAEVIVELEPGVTSSFFDWLNGVEEINDE